MNKKVIIAVVVVVVIGLAWWLTASKNAVAPTGGTAVKGGTETIYDQQLNGLDAADMTIEMQGVDADIQKL